VLVLYRVYAKKGFFEDSLPDKASWSLSDKAKWGGRQRKRLRSDTSVRRQAQTASRSIPQFLGANIKRAGGHSAGMADQGYMAEELSVNAKENAFDRRLLPHMQSDRFL
jgi:hypothetical protein